MSTLYILRCLGQSTGKTIRVVAPDLETAKRRAHKREPWTLTVDVIASEPYRASRVRMYQVTATANNRVVLPEVF